MSVIELRNKDAQLKKSNGDYEVILNNKLSLENGDSIFVKQSFLDTQSSSSRKIVLPDLSLKVGCFLTAQGITDDGRKLADGSAPPINNETMVASTVVSSGALAGVSFCKSQVFEFTLTGGKTTWGNFTVGYSYLDPVTGENRNASVFIPKKEYNGSGDSEKQTVPVNIMFKTSGGLIIFAPNNVTKIDPYNDTYQGAQDNVPVTEDQLSHYQSSSKLDFPAGTYTPEQLTNTFNRIFTDNSFYGGNITTYTNSPFIAQIGTSTQYNFFVELNGESYFQPTEDLYAGTSQIELAWDDAQQVFFFNYLHSPFYDSNGKISTKWITQTDSNKSEIVRNSCILFNHLSAFDSSGKYYPFWEDVLGFDLSTLLVTEGDRYEFNEGGIIGQASKILGADLGVASTGALSSIATVIDTQSTPYKVPTADFSVLSTKNQPIYAVKSPFSNIFNYGYFLIEINGKFKNNFYTNEKNIRGIQSVVSRYYESPVAEGGSYTSGTQEGSLIYTHKGEPILLEGFSVRILDPNKTVADGLGDDSTVFLEIVKAPPIPQNKK